jgi:hypothetical protein
MDSATLNIPPQKHHHTAVAVIRAEAAVFGGTPPKLRHGNNSDMPEMRSNVRMEGGQPGSQISQ